MFSPSMYPESTVRLQTHVLCKPTHFFFTFIATISYFLQTSFNSIMKHWADKYRVWGTPARSPSRSNSRYFKHAFFSHQKGTHIHVFLDNICRLYMSYHTLFEGVNFVLSYSTHIWNAYVSENLLKIKNAKNEACL